MPPNQNEKSKELGRKVEDVASAMRWVIERLGLVQSEVRKQSEIITKLADKASAQKDKIFSVRREIKGSPKIYDDPTQHEEYYIRVVEPGKRCEIAYCHFDERVIDGNKNWTSYFLNFEPKKKVWIPEAPTMGQLRYDNGPDKEAQGPSKPQKTPSQIIDELRKEPKAEVIDIVSGEAILPEAKEYQRDRFDRMEALFNEVQGTHSVGTESGDTTYFLSRFNERSPQINLEATKKITRNVGKNEVETLTFSTRYTANKQEHTVSSADNSSKGESRRKGMFELKKEDLRGQFPVATVDQILTVLEQRKR